MIVRFIHFILYIVINIIRLFKLTELYQPTYNPYNIPFVRNKTYARPSNDRIEKIASNIDLNAVSTYLDIGSQLGYFVFSINFNNIQGRFDICDDKFMITHIIIIHWYSRVCIKPVSQIKIGDEFIVGFKMNKTCIIIEINRIVKLRNGIRRKNNSNLYFVGSIVLNIN